MPRGTGIPNSRKTTLACYSWMFMVDPGEQRTDDGRQRGRHYFTEVLGCQSSVLRPLLSKARHDLEASVHQPAYGIDGFFQHRPLGPIEFDLHDPLDALGSDHHGDAYVEVFYAEFAVEVCGAG